MNTPVRKPIFISIHAIARISQRCIGYYLQTRRRSDDLDEDIVAWSKRISTTLLKHKRIIQRRDNQLIVRDKKLNFVFEEKQDKIVLLTVY